MRSMREQTAYEWYWERLNSMSVKEALASGVGRICPVCQQIHPGIRYGHPDHRQYCSTPRPLHLRDPGRLSSSPLQPLESDRVDGEFGGVRFCRQ